MGHHLESQRLTAQDSHLQIERHSATCLQHVLAPTAYQLEGGEGGEGGGGGRHLEACSQ